MSDREVRVRRKNVSGSQVAERRPRMNRRAEDRVGGSRSTADEHASTEIRDQTVERIDGRDCNWKRHPDQLRRGNLTPGKMMKLSGNIIVIDDRPAPFVVDNDGVYRVG